MDAVTILAMESIAGSVIAVLASVIILWVLSWVPTIQKIVFPSEDEARGVERLLNESEAPEKLDQLAASIMFAGLCIRYLGKVIFVGLIFTAILRQFGNFM